MAKRNAFLIEQAAKARRLARAASDEEISKKLRALADEYEALAKQHEPPHDPEDTVH